MWTRRESKLTMIFDDSNKKSKMKGGRAWLIRLRSGNSNRSWMTKSRWPMIPTTNIWSWQGRVTSLTKRCAC